MKELTIFADKVGFEYDNEKIETILQPGKKEDLAFNIYQKMKTIGFK